MEFLKTIVDSLSLLLRVCFLRPFMANFRSSQRRILKNKFGQFFGITYFKELWEYENVAFLKEFWTTGGGIFKGFSIPGNGFLGGFFEHRMWIFKWIPKSSNQRGFWTSNKDFYEGFENPGGGIFERFPILFKGLGGQTF